MVTIYEIAMHTGLPLSTVRTRLEAQGCEPIGKDGKKNLYGISATRQVTHPKRKPRPMKVSVVEKKERAYQSDYARIVFAYINSEDKRPFIIANELNARVYLVKEVIKDYLSRQDKSNERFEIFPSKMNDAD